VKRLKDDRMMEAGETGKAGSVFESKQKPQKTVSLKRKLYIFALNLFN
jgi:hypothetical protein